MCNKFHVLYFLPHIEGFVGTRYKVQGTRYKVQGTRYKVQGTRYKVQGTRHKVQGTTRRNKIRKYEIQQNYGTESLFFPSLNHALKPENIIKNIF